MSGGVDSSVAAYLMKKQGYDCMGVTMKLFHNEDIGIPQTRSCCSLDDLEDARNVAYELGIPYYVLNFSERFEEDVIERFVAAYENGMTPNPCIDCNRYLKFDELYRRARELGYDYVVTGHYAHIEKDVSSGRYLLKKALDSDKDQSYVLYALTQEQLAHTLTVIRRRMKEGGQLIVAVEPDPAQAQMKLQTVRTPDGKIWWSAFTSFEEELKGADQVKSTFLSEIGRMFEAALTMPEIAGIIINPWNRTIMLDKHLIRIIMPD